MIAKEYYHAFIGFISIIIAVCLFWLLLTLTNQQQSTMRIFAKFNNIEGINIGAKVMLSGIIIGQVAELSVDPTNYRVRVGMDIASDYAIPADSAVSVLGDGILGEKYMRIAPGGATQMMAAKDEFRYSQNTIDLVNTLEIIIENAEKKRGIDPNSNNLKANEDDGW